MTAPPSARAEMLARIRAAITAGTGSASDPVDAAYAALPREYLRAHHDAGSHDIVALFAERAADYRAVVERVPESGLASAVARVLTARVAAVPGPFLTPDGLPADWLPADWLTAPPAGIELAGDTPPRSAAELDRMTGVVTGCAVAIAETGTIILDHGPGQGRRALTLVPDFHLVVVRASQVAADLADAFARLDPARPHTLISGPSATSDIELIRVEGVHGPRNLHILLATSLRGSGAFPGPHAKSEYRPGAAGSRSRRRPGGAAAGFCRHDGTSCRQEPAGPGRSG